MNFLDLENKFTDANSSACVILPIPYEETTSYGKGTACGPQAIIEASAYVELYDDVYDLETYQQGIHTAPAIRFTGQIDADFAKITAVVNSYLSRDKFVISLGGEHSISYPVYRAFHDSFDNLSVLQFDAHSDLRESYEGSIYSHASVMRRIYEMNPSVVQFGIRSQCVEEANFIRRNYIVSYNAHIIKKQGFTMEIMSMLKKNVYITFDVDYFDPSIMPATGTPEPGGFQWDETIDFLDRVFREKNVVGCDVVELSPIPELPFGDFLTAKLVYKLITLKFK